MPADLNEFCKTIQRKLNAQVVRMEAIGPDQGTLAYLTSQENVTAQKFKATLDTGDGHIHTGRVRFLPRGTKAQYDTPPDTDICTSDDTVGYKYDPYVIDEVTPSVKLSFSYNQMREFCEGKDEHIAEVIYSQMHAYRSILNKKIVTKILNGGYVGNFANGVAGPKALPLFMTEDNKINPVGEMTIEQDMTAAEINGSIPRLIGSKLLQSYGTAKGIQCCNHDGYNNGLLSQVQGWLLDTTYDTILGTPSNVMAYIPGALQLLTMNYNKGDFRIVQPDHSHTTLMDPLIPGLEYDLYTHMVKCGLGNRDIMFNMQWELRWSLWGYPDELFDTTDELNGVTDVFHYQAVCSDANVCDLAGQEAAPLAMFTAVQTVDSLDLDATASSAQAPGATLVNFTWDFGGTVGVKSGAPGATITGTGFTGTFDHPVIDRTLADVGPMICLEVKDDNLQDSVAHCATV